MNYLKYMILKKLFTIIIYQVIFTIIIYQVNFIENVHLEAKDSFGTKLKKNPR